MRPRRQAWATSHRIIRTIYPPISLFEDLAPPADWEALVALEEATNPRIRDQIGNLALVPPSRRLGGPGTSLVMGCFTHASTDRPGRFSDGSYGVWYAGESIEVAIAETAWHFERFMRKTSEPPAVADMRELTAAVQGRWAAPPADCLVADDWKPGQAFGRAARDAGVDGVVYRSVRWPQGRAVGLFWPDGVTLPVIQARQFRYSWDGSRMDRYFIHGTREWTPYPSNRPNTLAV